MLAGISIDITAVDMSRVTRHENGKTYLSMTVSIDKELDRFGNNGSVWQQQTKEEREQQVNRNFLGNCKVLSWNLKENKPQQQQNSFGTGQ